MEPTHKDNDADDSEIYVVKYFLGAKKEKLLT